MDSPSFWLQSSLERVFPTSQPSEAVVPTIAVARGERASFQACVRNSGTLAISVGLSVEASDDIDIVVRRVGFVPMAHHNVDDDPEYDGVGFVPGLVPDPLWPESSAIVGPLETAAFWVTLKVAPDAIPGTRQVVVRVTVDDQPIGECAVALDVAPLVVQPANDFPVTHWFYADALCDWYKLQPYESAIWPIIERYMLDLVEHGGSCQYVPIFTPPTDGVKRPHQLLKVSNPAEGRYGFDFGDVRRWVSLARSCGARYFEWTHLFTQWGVEHAIRIYKDNADPQSLLWPPETPATSRTYRDFLSQFLPRFRMFLEGEGLLERSIFHVSDEPHGDEHLENYRAARAMLAELAPWMKVHDALSDIRFSREGLTDMPVASILTAKQFVDEGIPSCAYFCCAPRGKYLNRLMDTPLPKIRMSGWLFYKLNARGFLHWGYNYWYKYLTQQLIDPFTEQAGNAWPGLAYGDSFVVYPGADGPLDSIRWEVWAESMQDYALLQGAGIEPEDDMLSEITDYADFPKCREWISAARSKILRR